MLNPKCTVDCIRQQGVSQVQFTTWVRSLTEWEASESGSLLAAVCCLQNSWFCKSLQALSGYKNLETAEKLRRIKVNVGSPGTSCRSLTLKN